MAPGMTGRAIGIGKGFFREGILGGAVGTELIYSFVIIVCSLMVYFATKEMYELSTHKGIKYFRLTFLFFAIAYFFRGVIKFVWVYFGRGVLDISPMTFGQLTYIAFMYFSSIAVFYLLYSVMWKKFDKRKLVFWLMHTVALLIGVVSVVLKSKIMILNINIFLLLVVLLVVLLAYKDSSGNRKHGFYVVYLLLSVFWILNVIDVVVRNFMQIYQMLIYLVSVGLFLGILYKVLRRTG